MDRFQDHLKRRSCKELGISFGPKTLTEGQYIARSEATSTPSISFAEAEQATKYMVVCLDFDGPYTWFSVLSPILHWIQSDLTLDSSKPGHVLNAELPVIASYVGPEPPPGSSPHRYIFFLYRQPETFDSSVHTPSKGAEMGLWPRIRWNLRAWEQKTGLEKPVAIGHFTSS